MTIYGQSAGAGSVLQHIVAHGGHTEPPLFRAAMMSSPFLPFQFAYDDPVVEVRKSRLLPESRTDYVTVQRVYDALLKNVRFVKSKLRSRLCGLPASPSCASSKNTLDCLRKVSPEKLIAADLGVADANFMGTFTMNPVVDGKFIIERPTVTLRKSHTNVVRLVIWIRLEICSPKGSTGYGARILQYSRGHRLRQSPDVDRGQLHS